MTDHGSRIDIAGTRVRVGLFGVGLDTYWPQFEGLRDRLVGYQDQIAGRLREFGADLIDAGLVDTPVKAREAAALFRREEVRPDLPLHLDLCAVLHGAAGRAESQACRWSS